MILRHRVTNCTRDWCAGSGVQGTAPSPPPLAGLTPGQQRASEVQAKSGLPLC